MPCIVSALLPTFPHASTCHRNHNVQHPSSPTTTLNVFFSDDKSTSNNVNLGREKVNGSSSVDLFKTLELKDEALLQAQTAVSSLESALESAVTNLENMQQQLQLQVVQLEQELEATREELGITQSQLEQTKAELESKSNQLEMALAQGQIAADRANELEAYVTTLKENEKNAATAPPPVDTAKSRESPADNPWQLFSSTPKIIPVLNEWIAIKGTNEGEVQISGKVTNHPSIPDGDAIVTSPLVDANKAVERKIVTTLSGSKYRLGTPMTMPASDSASQKITSDETTKKRPQQQLIKARSSISIPDLTGNTLGNG